MTTRNRIVLTGFAPFDGAATNPSWDAVQIAGDSLKSQTRSIVIERLPVEFRAAAIRVAELLTEHSPSVFIAAGLAATAKGLRLERLAVNLIDAAIPDNVGVQPQGVPVRFGAPATYATTLPNSVTGEWTAADIPWEDSDNAGRYVCNATFFNLQHLACDASLAMPSPRAQATGFIHVPPETVVPVETSAKAIAIAAHHAIRRPN